MSIPKEAIEAGARALSPHLWNGKLESALLRLTGRVSFTPEQAAESVHKKQKEALADAEVIITAAAPIIQAAALRAAAADSQMGPVPHGWNAAGIASWLRARADQLEGTES